jgi:uncharacterized membrane protein HdeD (DUF308 family)
MLSSPRTQFAGTLIVRGVLGVALGILAFSRPLATVAALAMLFGIYAVVDGLGAIVMATSARASRLSSSPFVVEGMVGVGAGLGALAARGVAAVALFIIMAAWSMASGVFRIAGAAGLHGRVPHERLLTLSGAAAIALSLVIVRSPDSTASGLVDDLGAYALGAGVALGVCGVLVWRRVASHLLRTG